MTKKLISVVIAASTAQAAVAQRPADRLVETTISYADLNLSNAAGRATLDSRIKGAARFVCGAATAATVAEHNHIRDCRANAVASANAQLEQQLARRGAGAVLAARR
jgi:UrcA family protein